MASDHPARRGPPDKKPDYEMSDWRLACEWVMWAAERMRRELADAKDEIRRLKKGTE